MKDNDRDLFRLEHILESAEKIEKIINLTESVDVFVERWLEQDAMIRNFEIIGEAANHLSESIKEKYPEVEWHKIRGMRNFVAHKYFGIKMKTIWNTAITDIPALKKQIQKMIADVS